MAGIKRQRRERREAQALNAAQCRDAIRDLLQQEPRLTHAQLKALCGRSGSSIVGHLAVLERERRILKVRAYHSNRCIHFAMPPPKLALMDAYRCSDAQHRLLAAMMDAGGPRTMTSLARDAGAHTAVVRVALHGLRDAGLAHGGEGGPWGLTHEGRDAARAARGLGEVDVEALHVPAMPPAWHWADAAPSL